MQFVTHLFESLVMNNLTDRVQFYTVRLKIYQKQADIFKPNLLSRKI